MRRSLRFGVVSVLCIGCAAGIVAQPESMYGFSARAAEAERRLEQRFLLLPSARRAREVHAYLTAEPHVAGTPRDRTLAEWVRDRWREDGLEQVAIVEHQVLLPYPTEVVVEMTAPTPWRASMKEDPVDGDPFTARDTGLPYHAYSASGDATAAVVYANSGNPSDYDWLAAHGVDVRGRIVLVRYSLPYSYRGFKVLTAQRRGAAGILIYSDPADDGAGKGRTYPNGPWGPLSHIQRGGVPYDFTVPGDPLTPGWPSVPGAKRIDRGDAVSLPTIMSAPLSAKDASAILRALGGPVAPETWHGRLPFPYHVGAGPAVVHLRLQMDDAIRPIWTVTGRIAGTTHPDQRVIVGNHRDAWVYGGVDPSSGTAALMEVARSLGALAQSGSRPKRTIEFASWDAEEFTLTSSTEWGEQHARELSDDAVAYLNVDSAVSGTSFAASAVPSLNRLITEAAEVVIDPETGKSIAAAMRAGRPREASALPTASGSELVSNRLGSGSDYTVFLNFIGVPVADLSFTGPYGVYHSAYDDHIWMKRFGDPSFRYHAAMAELWGLLALRLANADILPLDYRAYAARISQFVVETERVAPASARVRLEPLEPAAARFAGAAQRAAAAAREALAVTDPDPKRTAAINVALMRVERAFTDRRGLPGRPWYRHLIYAPQPTYAPEVLPGVAETLAAGPSKLDEQVRRLVAALDRATAILDGR
jgi:N-acetylated-alpha-linked acidic dipeptidase